MISAFIVAIIWGITPIIYKSILNDLSYHTVLIFSALTFFIASIFYTIIYYKEISNDIKIYPHKLLYIALYAFIGLFIANILYHYAIKHTDNIAIIITITSIYPLITLILSYYILYEDISAHNIIGILLIIIGIVFLIK
jgi:transporter family protein